MKRIVWVILMVIFSGCGSSEKWVIIVEPIENPVYFEIPTKGDTAWDFSYLVENSLSIPLRIINTGDEGWETEGADIEIITGNSIYGVWYEWEEWYVEIPPQDTTETSLEIFIDSLIILQMDSYYTAPQDFYGKAVFKIRLLSMIIDDVIWPWKWRSYSIPDILPCYVDVIVKKKEGK